MQELILDLSGEFGAEFQAYVNSGNADVAAEIGCDTTVGCPTVACTVLQPCCLP
ncbi:hypothetical protein PS918_05569 [Pseudomonas fluorescens]|uniref:Uncharacterized protein n=1 Tax=Pseudomonas fluorescens TaxID=294 RepID=A0A5E7UPU7_PSEFL|nr:hypothetical protein [Pseudomonas fluorescens]VVQ13221.1 hypothetical protein PS918_05569 [Pseudomonas fluorescens]